MDTGQAGWVPVLAKQVPAAGTMGIFIPISVIPGFLLPPCHGGQGLDAVVDGRKDDLSSAQLCPHAYRSGRNGRQSKVGQIMIKTH